MRREIESSFPSRFFFSNPLSLLSAGRPFGFWFNAATTHWLRSCASSILSNPWPYCSHFFFFGSTTHCSSTQPQAGWASPSVACGPWSRSPPLNSTTLFTPLALSPQILNPPPSVPTALSPENRIGAHLGGRGSFPPSLKRLLTTL